MSEPVWLEGGAAPLSIACGAPTLWLTHLGDPAVRDRAEAVALLPGEAARYATRADAGERLLRLRLARLLLAAAGGCRPDAVNIERTPLGAPLVTVPAGWHLSVAARWPDCLVGVAPVPLGVDLERADPAAPAAADLLTARERERLDAAAAADRPRFFARACAAKESHAKRFGDPRRIDPASIDTEEARVRSPLGTTRCRRHDRGALAMAVATDR